MNQNRALEKQERLDPFNIDDVFQMRDKVKQEFDIKSACSDLLEVEKEYPSSIPLKFNIGICYYELKEWERAFIYFAHCLQDFKRAQLLRQFQFDAVKLIMKSRQFAVFPAQPEHLPLDWNQVSNRLIDKNNGLEHYPSSLNPDNTLVDTIVGIFVSVPLAAKEELAKIFAISLRPDEFEALLKAIRHQDETYSLDKDSLRALFERSSAYSKLGCFDRCVAISNPLQSEAETELQLIRTLFLETSRDRWYEDLTSIIARSQSLTQDDGFRLAQQAIGFSSLPDELSLNDALFELSGRFWGVRRQRGIVYERNGDIDAALACYQDAVQLELTASKRSAKLKTLAPYEVKISCIALSYNDQALVRHFCNMVMPHCDEIIVNDGGSTDGTVEKFKQFSRDTGFPVRVIEDRQHGNRDRSLENKEGYRQKNLGGVLAFEADRRRTLTLIEAEHDYILMMDLDDFLPPFPNLHNLVAVSYGIDHFAGSRSELIGAGRYTTLFLGPLQAAPTLFKKHRKHVYAGIDGNDEYLSRTDIPLKKWAMDFIDSHLSYCFNYWHLKYAIDNRFLSQSEVNLGVKSNLKFRFDRPFQSAVSSIAQIY